MKYQAQGVLIYFMIYANSMECNFDGLFFTGQKNVSFAHISGGTGQVFNQDFEQKNDA